MSQSFRLGNQELTATIVHRSPDVIEVSRGDETAVFRCDCSGRQLILDGDRKRYRTLAARQKDRIFVWIDGRILDLLEVEASALESAVGGSQNEIRSPMPGTIIQLNVAVGEAVEAGRIVAVLEAMKMEHNLRAPRNGKISKVEIAVGQTVSADALLISLESDE